MMQPCQWFQRLSKIPTLTSNMYMISCHMDYFSNIIQTQQIMFGSLQHLSIGYRLFKPKTRHNIILYINYDLLG
jgi:hypothetical protein